MEETKNKQDDLKQNSDGYSIHFNVPMINFSQIQVMSDNDLFALLDCLENAFEMNATLIFDLYDRKVIEDVLEKGLVSQLIEMPSFQTLQFNLGPIVSIEEEMKKRNILNKFRSNTSYIDYKTGERFTYNTYMERFTHLVDMFFGGYMDSENIDMVMGKIMQETLEKQQNLLC